jgi:pyruvate dehydrogenase E1 component alpha subunit
MELSVASKEEVPSKDVQLLMYRRMLLIRRFEERAGQQYGLGKIAGFCHLYIGQEAVGVGAGVACDEQDYTIDGYREHGHALARGADPKRVMAELFGKKTGYALGKGGSMHIFDVEHRFMGGYGIVGGQIPLATGIGYAGKYRNDGTACVCFFGDAAINQGAYHESLNMAALWKLPVVYIVENNRYGMGTPIAVSNAITDFSQRSHDYGIPGESVDGMDAVAMWRTVRKALARAKKGEGPTLIEARCYRFRGHSMADPATYRTKEEVEKERQRDPLVVMKAYLAKAGVDEAALAPLDAEIDAEVAASIQFADQSPDPVEADLYADVMAAPAN